MDHNIIYQATLLLIWFLTKSWQKPLLPPPLSNDPTPFTLPKHLEIDVNDTIYRFVTLMRGREVTQGKELWQLASLWNTLEAALQQVYG